MRLLLALLVCLGMAGPAAAACRLALALGLDVSGSVDDDEYRLQLDGLAEALGRPAVREALLALPGAPVWLSVFEWSGPALQRALVPWTALQGEADIAAVGALLRGTGRAVGDPSTAIGAALGHAQGLLAERSGCWRRVFDVSGDGRSNTGPRPQDVRDGLGDITVNALVIGEDPRSVAAGAGNLADYFRAQVIHGADAFVETASGYDDYADAMERKLLRELQAMAIGLLWEDGRALPFWQAPRQ